MYISAGRVPKGITPREGQFSIGQFSIHDMFEQSIRSGFQPRYDLTIPSAVRFGCYGGQASLCKYFTMVLKNYFQFVCFFLLLLFVCFFVFFFVFFFFFLFCFFFCNFMRVFHRSSSLSNDRYASARCCFFFFFFFFFKFFEENHCTIYKYIANVWFQLRHHHKGC